MALANRLAEGGDRDGRRDRVVKVLPQPRHRDPFVARDRRLMMIHSSGSVEPTSGFHRFDRPAVSRPVDQVVSSNCHPPNALESSRGIGGEMVTNSSSCSNRSSRGPIVNLSSSAWAFVDVDGTGEIQDELVHEVEHGGLGQDQPTPDPSSDRPSTVVSGVSDDGCDGRTPAWEQPQSLRRRCSRSRSGSCWRRDQTVEEAETHEGRSRESGGRGDP